MSGRRMDRTRPNEPKPMNVPEKYNRMKRKEGAAIHLMHFICAHGIEEDEAEGRCGHTLNALHMCPWNRRG
jgi:hypothetical protein